MILFGSRYEDSEVSYVLNPRTSIPAATVFRNPPTEQPARDRVWFWRDGDRIDSLAYRFYGSSSQWYRIADANPAVLNPAGLRPGTSLVIP